MIGPWDRLEIEPTSDVKAIRRAYARLLKTLDPEVDLEGFAALRHARDWAMYLAEQGTGGLDEIAVVLAMSGDIPSALKPEVSPEEHAAPTIPPEAPASVNPPKAADLEAGVDTAADLWIPPDFEAMQALHDLVFDTTRRGTPAQMVVLVQRILGDPAMRNLDHADHVERYLADTIVDGTPYSDPLIDPAMAYFRWESPDTELHRPSTVDWILQRSKDRYFELELRVQNQYAYRSLRRLRQPPPSGLPGWFDSWCAGPHVEYVIVYLQTYHPTILNGLNEPSYAWWVDRLQRQRSAIFPIGPFYRWRTNMARSKSIDRQRTSRSAILLRVLAVFFMIGPIMNALIAITYSPSASQRAQTAALAAFRDHPSFADVDHDLTSVLRPFSDGALTAGEIRKVNPALYARLKREWTIAGTLRSPGNEEASRQLMFATGKALTGVMRRAIRTSDDTLVLDYANYFRARLGRAKRGWTEGVSPDMCADLLAGRPDKTAPASLRAVRTGLLVRAVRTGIPPADVVDATTRFAVPDDFVEDASQRARLRRADFEQALMGKGSAPAQCNAQMALIDSAIARRDKAGIALLRAMFGG